jgi:hypothetical protein
VGGDLVRQLQRPLGVPAQLHVHAPGHPPLRVHARPASGAPPVRGRHRMRARQPPAPRAVQARLGSDSGARRCGGGARLGPVHVRLEHVVRQLIERVHLPAAARGEVRVGTVRGRVGEREGGGVLSACISLPRTKTTPPRPALSSAPPARGATAAGSAAAGVERGVFVRSGDQQPPHSPTEEGAPWGKTSF